MANKKITELTELLTPTSSDLLAIINAGVTKKITISNLTPLLSSPTATIDTDVRSLSSNWQTTYNTVSSLSGLWDSVYTSVKDTSANWDSVYTSVKDTSANWDSVYSTSNTLSSNWQTTHSTVSSLSGLWSSDYIFKQLGVDIDGEAAFDNSGWSVSINAAGDIVAIGAYGNDGNGSSSGHVRVYKFISGSWVQQGLDIDGELAVDNSGISVSINAAGDIVAIGAPYNDGNGSDSGHVRVYTNDLGYIADSYKLSNLNPTASGLLTVVGNISATGLIYGNGSNSANWDSVYTSVKDTSANWDSVYSTSNTLSSNWQSTYTTFSSTSATYVKTTSSTIPGVSAVTNIVAVSALPASPNPSTFYIIL